MRLRKVKHADSFLEANADRVIQNPEACRGKWKEMFPNCDGPIHLEIGCGKGKFITEMAIKHPDINFIGIEKYASVLLRTLEKLIQKPLDNVLLIHGDAAMIDLFFAPREIQRIYLNFSDPWPKSRKAKYRLTYDSFLRKYADLLENDGTIKFKTDNFGFFEYSMLNFNHDMNYTIQAVSLDLSRENIENVKTEFEERYSSLGQRIFYIEVINQRRNS
ncbi:MAG: tRNA (guanosine(46)-N7)-methyltransferase TrmB [Bacilli bacterium]|nr:tRNA (guanosine(46)-N7)-methyltransferase TrmB [Bacilli bacterium]